jgi:hypothetical protein
MTDPGDPTADIEAIDGIEAIDDLDEDTLAEEEREADERDIGDLAADLDETPFDDTRQQYSGVEDGDGDVDVAEYAAAGALLDDPEDTVLLQGGIDDPDGRDG